MRRRSARRCAGSKVSLKDGGGGDLPQAAGPGRRGGAEPARGRQVLRGADLAGRGEGHAHRPGNPCGAESALPLGAPRWAEPRLGPRVPGVQRPGAPCAPSSVPVVQSSSTPVPPVPPAQHPGPTVQSLGAPGPVPSVQSPSAPDAPDPAPAVPSSVSPSVRGPGPTTRRGTEWLSAATVVSSSQRTRIQDCYPGVAPWSLGRTPVESEISNSVRPISSCLRNVEYHILVTRGSAVELLKYKPGVRL